LEYQSPLRSWGSSVPRYYFHFSDGKRQFTDGSGVELSGMAAARANATRQVRELKVAMCQPHVQDLSRWSMTVLDAKKFRFSPSASTARGGRKAKYFSGGAGPGLALAGLRACGAKGI
jgi:Domain of unknown function (DUF6894)